MRVYCSLGIEGGISAAKKVLGHKFRLVHRSFNYSEITRNLIRATLGSEAGFVTNGRRFVTSGLERVITPYGNLTRACWRLSR